MVALAIFLACCACAFALNPSLDISQYAHTSWKIRDGFTKGTIRSIAQTPDGYLWLGTEFGLLRFDGIRAVQWRPPAGQQLPSPNIRRLLVSRDGTLWIGTQGGLASWKDGKLITYPEISAKLADPWLEDDEGTVWVALNQPGGVCTVRSARTQCQGAAKFGLGAVVALYKDRKGSLWVSASTGLWRWAPGPPQRYALPHGVSYANSLIEGDDGALLLATAAGLKEFAAGNTHDYTLPGLPGDITPNYLFRSTDGGLWISTHAGLLRLYRGRLNTFSAGDGLSSDSVLRVFEDREGSLWVSTVEGLDRFRELAVPRISSREGLLSSSTQSVQAASDGSVWIGTAAGLNQWRGGRVAIAYGSKVALENAYGHERGRTFGTRGITNSGLKGTIGCLGIDDTGRLWATTNEGVFYFADGRFVRVPGLAGDYTVAISGDGHGSVWILNGSKGLFQMVAKGPVQKISSLPPISSGETYWGVLLPDRSGNGLWLGSIDGGLVYFKNGHVRFSYNTAEGLGAARVNHLRVGSRGSLWAATEGGLSRLKDGHISTLTGKNGLPCDAVQWSMEDDDHAIWLYMSCGLARIERSELDAWVSDPKHVVKTTVFDATDGVRSQAHLNSNTPPVTKSTDGKIWFVAWDGVSVIDPRHLAFNKLPPPVNIEQFTADDKRYDARNGMRLPPRVHNLAIDYTALSLVVPEKVRFRVKLEGQDKDWRELVNVRHVEYTNLPPKHYRFRVLACNNSGVWNEEGAALDFVIPPCLVPDELVPCGVRGGVSGDALGNL